MAELIAVYDVEECTSESCESFSESRSWGSLDVVGFYAEDSRLVWHGWLIAILSTLCCTHR